MTPEEHELLRRGIALSEENNSILRGIQSSMRLARFMTFLYWLIIIGLSVGAWYFVQPYWNNAMSVYNAAQVQLKNISGAAGKINSVSGDAVSNVSGAVNNAGGTIDDIVNAVKKSMGK